ncbi:MAG: hypothetical protein GKS06_08660 [Acidobacteria bacterium]|nr:hypothetical protein [Acidobacteriota bacterium]
MASNDFDNRWGTDTDGEIPIELLEHDAAIAGQAVSYEPTDPDAFRVMVRELAIAREDYTFLDLGSGKGRVVLLAAQAGFGRVVGIEASPLLHHTACTNLRVWAQAGHGTRHIDLRSEDAAGADIPPGPCVVYLFNPFRERAMSRLLRQIRRSLQHVPRDLWLLYYNPQARHLLESSDCLARVTVGRGFQQGDYEIWRSHAAFRGE